MLATEKKVYEIKNIVRKSRLGPDRQALLLNIINKQIEYQPQLTSIGSIPVRKCKCGMYYTDLYFDGYCGFCGQRIKWNDIKKG